MSERTTVRLPPDLLRRAKRKAAREGRTLTALIEDGLRLVTADRRQERSAPTILPRISKAGGGLMPGIDLSDLRGFEDDEDARYLQRMKRAP